ncbi:UNKNOWN [Stylonychia lemnae]|uniref:Mitochondrial carrier protein n=1 Tax=Stylonychia lemnae TaxID=5949 RepID=A0A078BDQ2_STYLE|nr:UNKNOWN [Stylonychia lemnae]|eukprot:CDW91307.1 UNKNOWN [Stylonychia lemnae]
MTNHRAILAKKDETQAIQRSNQSIVDLASGCMSGFSTLIIGHPLEERAWYNFVETNTKNLSERRSKNNQLQLQPLGFYKGLGPPLLNAPISYSISFGSFEYAKSLLNVSNQTKDQSFLDFFYCGAFSGIVDSLFSTPIDLVKMRLQVQVDNKSNSYYKGPIDCLQKIVKDCGMRGLYRGLLSNIIRQIPLCGTSFGVYFQMKKNLAYYQSCDVNQLGIFSKMISGFTSGLLCWVQRHVQFKNFNKFIPDGGIVKCAQHIYRNEGGMRAFWRGFSACSVRSSLNGSISYLVYEFFQSQFRPFVN